MSLLLFSRAAQAFTGPSVRAFVRVLGEAVDKFRRAVLKGLGDDGRSRGATLQLKISHNFPEVQRGLDKLQNDLRTKALPRALDRMAELSRTEMRRQITAVYNVKATEVRERLKLKRARLSPDGATAELFVDSRRGRSLNVVRFLVGGSAKGSRMTKAQARRKLKAGTKAALKVRIKKGSIKPLGPAFLGIDGRTVFRRVGPARFPIEAVRTIDVGQMFNQRSINESVRAFIVRRWPEVMEREMGYFIRQWQRR